MDMDLFFTGVAIAMLVLMSLISLRMILGPTVFDRLVAVNIIGTKAAVLLVIMGLIFHRVDMFVDIAIGYGLLNFIASIAAAKFFQHNKELKAETIKERNS